MKTCFVTNIPTPYRISMYNRLIKLAKIDDKRFFVYFMNGSESNRSWVINEEFSFEHKVWNLKTLLFKGVYIRFSILFIFSAIRNSDHLILGGSWNDLNVMAIVLLKRLRLINNTISFWTEANYLTLGAKNSTWLKKVIRRFILNSADGHYFIPGEMSRISLIKWGVTAENKTVYLPNLPHEKFDDSIGCWMGSNNTELVFTIIARLDEKTKGVLNFLKGIGVARLLNIKLNIIGSGSDVLRYKNYINSNGLANNVFILGELPSDIVLKYLILSDVFILPSFSDPSPLSLVEACKIGLPVLVSKCCGNHFECVAIGQNGFIFDPYDRDSMINAFDMIISNKSMLSIFSKKSIALARENFDTDAVLSRLVSKL